jgi:hypothetical protein
MDSSKDFIFQTFLTNDASTVLSEDARCMSLMENSKVWGINLLRMGTFFFSHATEHER